MIDPLDAVADLSAAATRARRLADEIGGAVLRAEALVRETDWQAQAAWRFRGAMRGWCADVTDVRALLADLADEASAAAGDARYRLELSAIGAMR